MPVYNPRWGKIPDKEERRQFNEAIFNLQRGNTSSGAWGLIMANINKRWDNETPLISAGLLPISTATGSSGKDQGVVRGGTITLGVNYTAFNELGGQAQQEILIITMQKIFNGRLGERGARMEKTYGKLPTEIGMLMYLSRYCPHENLVLEGYEYPEPEMFKLEKDQTWEFYTAALQNRASEISADMQWTSSEIEDEVDPSQADQGVKRLINQCERDLEGFSGRGFVAGDGYEFIKTLFAPPQVDWTDHLHMLESGKGRAFCLPNKRKPSRREGPNYIGHSWHGRCNVLLVCDTSGSRGKKQIAALFPELRACVARGATVVFAQADAVIQDVKIFEGVGDEDFERFGCGGTELQPTINQAKDIADMAGVDSFDFMIVATDGYCDNLDFGDMPALVLLDSDGASLDEFAKMVQGSSVTTVVLQIPSDEDDPNSQAKGN